MNDGLKGFPLGRTEKISQLGWPPGAQPGALMEIAAAQLTSTATVSATTEATATALITLPAVELDGLTPVIAEFSCPWWGHDGTTDTSFLTLFDSFNDGTAAAVGRMWDARAYGGLIQCIGIVAKYRIGTELDPPPARGKHVYSIRAHTAAPNFYVQCGAGGAGTDVPALLTLMAVAL